jgi:hypothetical protein
MNVANLIPGRSNYVAHTTKIRGRERKLSNAYFIILISRAKRKKEVERTWVTKWGGGGWGREKVREDYGNSGR